MNYAMFPVWFCLVWLTGSTPLYDVLSAQCYDNRTSCKFQNCVFVEDSVSFLSYWPCTHCINTLKGLSALRIECASITSALQTRLTTPDRMCIEPLHFEGGLKVDWNGMLAFASLPVYIFVLPRQQCNCYQLTAKDSARMHSHLVIIAWDI